jgi:phosphoesterase RecJ-like protein
VIDYKKPSSEILRAIKKSKQILLHLHRGPDGDSVGSALAMMHYLTSIGKKVTLISGDSDPPTYLSSLPGFKKIKNQSFQKTNLKKYDLFIILDSGDLNQISSISEIIFPKSLNTVTIDHHHANPGYANINLVDKDAPATCQIIYKLFKLWKFDITPEIAVCLYIGIYQDTMFKYPGTSYITFEICAHLTKLYPDFTKIVFDMENSNHPSRLKLQGIALNSIETYLDDHLAISSISNQDIVNNSFTTTNISGNEMANILRSVTGWTISAHIIEYQPNHCKISLRTRNSDKYDVSKIAMAVGVGGGHKASSGSTVDLPLPETKKLLVDTVKKIYPRLK